jgi:hypothetical protein
MTTKTKTKLTIDDMVRRAVDDRLYMEAMDQGERSYRLHADKMHESEDCQLINTVVIECPPPVRFLPGTGLSHGLASVSKQAQEADCGIDWLLVAIASWVAVGGERSEQDGFDENLMDENTYADLIKTYSSMREWAQFFELRPWGTDGAELCVKGGVTETQADTELFPIQRWHFTDFPWGRGTFGVWVFREAVGEKLIWTLMLPAEY